MDLTYQYASIDDAIRTMNIVEVPITIDSLYARVVQRGVTYNVMLDYLQRNYQWTRPHIPSSIEAAIKELRDDHKTVSIRRIHTIIADPRVPLYEVASYMHEVYDWPMDTDVNCAELARDVEVAMSRIHRESLPLNIDSVIAQTPQHKPSEIAAYLHAYYGWNDGWNAREIKKGELDAVDAICIMFSNCQTSLYGKVKEARWHGKRTDGHEFHLSCEFGTLVLHITEFPEALLQAGFLYKKTDGSK